MYVKRALRICDRTSKQIEMEHLARVFEANGFQDKLIRQALSRTPTQKDHEYQPEEEPQRRLHIPYVRGLSERLEKACASPGVKASSSLKQLLVRVK